MSDLTLPTMVPPQMAMPMAPGPQLASTAAPCGDPMVDGMLYIRELVVKQKMKAWKALLEWFGGQTENKYKVYNPLGANPKDEVFVAREDSACMCRCLCKNKRSFTLTISTSDDRHVATVVRNFHLGSEGCCCGCIPCCCIDCAYQMIDVYAGESCQAAGKLLGRVVEKFSCCHPHFAVLDANGNEIFRINSLSVKCCVCGKATFVINPAGGDAESEKLGVIKKKWGGAAKEFFSDADTFCISFPEMANGEQRLVLLGAIFLIDFLFFENNSSQASDLNFDL